MYENERIVILAEGKFGLLSSKTANQAIRYIPERILGVVDSTNAGKDAHDVLGFGRGIPVIRNLKEALGYNPDALLIGIAMNTVMMGETEIDEAKRDLEKQTGLPVADALTPEIRYLADAVVKYFS